MLELFNYEVIYHLNISYKVDYIVNKFYTLFKDNRWDFEHCVKHNIKEDVVIQNEWIDKCMTVNMVILIL